METVREIGNRVTEKLSAKMDFDGLTEQDHEKLVEECAQLAVLCILNYINAKELPTELFGVACSIAFDAANSLISQNDCSVGSINAIRQGDALVQFYEHKKTCVQDKMIQYAGVLHQYRTLHW